MTDLLALNGSVALKYDEVRMWSYYLHIFTADDLADAMGVPVEAIEGMVLGLAFNGTIEQTGHETSNEAAVYQFVPLPGGPRKHFTRAPEWSAAPGVGTLAPRNRGHAVRIRTERDQRKSMSTPGARGRIKRREQRYQQMQAKVAERQSNAERKLKAGRAKGKKDWEI